MKYADSVLDDIFGIGWLSGSPRFVWREGGIFLQRIPENIARLMSWEELDLLQAHPTGNRTTEPALPVPFDLSQFLAFLACDAQLMSRITVDYANELPFVSVGEDRMLVPDDDAINELAAVNQAAARLVRLVVAGAKHDIDPLAADHHRSTLPELEPKLVVTDLSAAPGAPSALAVPMHPVNEEVEARPRTPVQHRLGRRRDALDPPIDAAIARGGGSLDPSAVWNELLAMADEKLPLPPLIGIADGEIKYRDAIGNVAHLSRNAVAKRLHRRAATGR